MTSEAKTTAIAVFVSAYVSAMFYGLTSAQALSYFKSKRSKRDAKLLRSMVLILWFLDTIDSAFIGLATYHVDISDFAGILSYPIYWSFALSVLLEGITEVIVRSFYCFRIWKLSHSWVLTALASVFNLVAGVFAIWLAAAAFVSSPTGIRGLKVVTFGFTISAVVADATIAAILVYFLWRMHHNSSYAKTISLTGTLIVYTVSTGALTSLSALIVLITYVGSDSLAYSGVRLVVAKVYVNAVLATLNQRSILRDGHSLQKQTFDSSGSNARPADSDLNVTSNISVDILSSLEDNHAMKLMATDRTSTPKEQRKLDFLQTSDDAPDFQQ